MGRPGRQRVVTAARQFTPRCGGRGSRRTTGWRPAAPTLARQRPKTSPCPSSRAQLALAPPPTPPPPPLLSSPAYTKRTVAKEAFGKAVTEPPVPRVTEHVLPVGYHPGDGHSGSKPGAVPVVIAPAAALLVLVPRRARLPPGRPAAVPKRSLRVRRGARPLVLGHQRKAGKSTCRGRGGRRGGGGGKASSQAGKGCVCGMGQGKARLDRTGGAVRRRRSRRKHPLSPRIVPRWRRAPSLLSLPCSLSRLRVTPHPPRPPARPQCSLNVTLTYEGHSPYLRGCYGPT